MPYPSDPTLRSRLELILYRYLSQQLRCSSPFHRGMIKAIEIDPSNTKAIFNLAQVYLEIRRYDNAINLFRCVLLLQPNHLDAHVNLALALIDRSSTLPPKEALQDMQRALQVYQHISTSDAINLTPKLLEDTQISISYLQHTIAYMNESNLGSVGGRGGGNGF